MTVGTALYIALTYLVVLAILDVTTFQKKPFIPSVLTTSYIILMLLIQGASSIPYGILGALLGLAIWEFNSEWGLADIKVLIGTSMLANNFVSVLLFTVLVALLGILYISAFRAVMKAKKITSQTVIPFLPVFLLSFLVWFPINQFSILARVIPWV